MKLFKIVVVGGLFASLLMNFTLLTRLDEVNNRLNDLANQQQMKRQQTEKKGRFIIGRKGLGKLSFFGIAETIEITTVKDNHKTTFQMDWQDIIKCVGKPYNPRLIKSEQTNESSGTLITLSKIKRKSEFESEPIAFNLSKHFQIFDEIDFKVTIIHKNSKSETKETVVENGLKYKNIEQFCSWKIPDDMPPELSDEGYYEYNNNIEGTLIATTETVPSSMRGIALFSRGKLVNNHDFLQVKATSHGYSYISGWLDVSFIENFDIDAISTDRQSLIWELQETEDLKSFLEDLYRSFFNFQKGQRESQKLIEVQSASGIDLQQWIKELPKHERKLAKKMTDAIIKSDGIDVQKSAELLQFTHDSFQFATFKEFASEIEDVEFNDPTDLIRLFNEWNLIESKEMSKLAIGRIQAIKTFERLIESNALEVKEVHPFFVKFPWALDPRINMFKHEAHYQKLLQEHYPDNENYEDENDRRIDFLCTSVANNYFVIELKRPKSVIRKKDLEQAIDYQSFVESYLTKGHDGTMKSNVVAYIIGGSMGTDRMTQKYLDTFNKTGDVYFKSYLEMLGSTKKYHAEFLEKFEEIHQDTGPDEAERD